MTEDGRTTGGMTLEDLALELVRVREESERAQKALREENDRLSSRLATMEGRTRPEETSSSIVTADPNTTDEAHSFSRRGALLALGGAAASAVAILGTDAAPAAAAQGADVVLGQDNLGAKARTGIFSTTSELFLTVADPSVTVDGAATTAGVVGSGGHGLVGSGTAQDGWGVLGTDSGINGSGGSSACGGVTGLITNPANPNFAVQGQTAGVAAAMFAAVTNESSFAPALYTLNQGAGAGVLSTDLGGGSEGARAAGSRAGTGPGVVSEIRNTENRSAAIMASTAGPGHALDVQASSGAALSASSTQGPGAQFASSVAQLRLTPGRTRHPESGQVGDLFVDVAGHLWFCRGTTTWVKLA